MLKVSFIISIEEKYVHIEKCLDSIIKQQGIQKEIIIVHNKKEDKKLRSLLNKINQGNDLEILYKCEQKLNTLGQMRNYGVQLSKGDYIVFVRPNDFLEKDSISSVIDTALEHNSDIVISRNLLYNPKIGSYEFKKNDESLKGNNIINPNDKYNVLRDMNLFDKLFKASLIKNNDIKFSNTQYYDYILFQMNALSKANVISTYSKAYYVERLKTGLEKIKSPTLENTIDEQQVDDFIKNYDNVISSVCNQKNDTVYDVISQLHINFILKRGLKYLNITADKDRLFKLLSDSISDIDWSNMQLKQKESNILDFVKRNDINGYYNFLSEQKKINAKKKNKKRYYNNVIFSGIYKVCSYLPVRNREVLFVSHSPGMDGNFEYIDSAIKKYNENSTNRRKFKTKFITTKTNFFKRALVPFKLSRAEYVILAENVPFFNLINVRKETSVIQSWHAGGAFKKFGYSTNYMEGGPNPFENKKMNLHNYYDYATVSSEEVRRHYAEAFNMDIEKVIPVGVPRADFFFMDDKVKAVQENIYSLYPSIKGKKVILYAPTFRGCGKTRKNFVMDFDVNNIARNISDDYVIMLKLHPSVEQSNIHIDADVAHKIVNATAYKDANDILTVTDILITDYSSIVFDFSLLKKPMIFYAYDLEDYILDRDFYYEYKDFIPGPLAKTNDEIIKIINENKFDINKVEEFSNKFFIETGHSADKFVTDVLVKLDEKKRGK